MNYKLTNSYGYSEIFLGYHQWHNDSCNFL